MEPDDAERAYEGPPSMQRPTYHVVVPPSSNLPNQFAQPGYPALPGQSAAPWLSGPPPGSAPPTQTWGESIGRRIRSAHAPWSRWILPLVWIIITVTNSLPILTLSSTNKDAGYTSISGWSLPAGAWAFVLLLLAIAVHGAGLIPALARRINLGALIGALLIGGGLCAIVGYFDLSIRTTGLPISEATMNVGPIIAVIAGGLAVVAGALEFFQLSPSPAVRPRLKAYLALSLPILAIVSFAPRAIDATQSGRRVVGYLDLVTATNSVSEQNQARGAVYDQIGSSGWSFGLLAAAGLVIIVSIIPALVQILSRRPIRVPVQFVSAAALLLAGLLIVTWFFVSMLSRNGIRESLAKFPLEDSVALDVTLTFAAYLVLALGVVALGLGALQAIEGSQQPRPPRAARPGGPTIGALQISHPAGYGSPSNPAAARAAPIGYRPQGPAPAIRRPQQPPSMAP